MFDYQIYFFVNFILQFPSRVLLGHISFSLLSFQTSKLLAIYA
jgi:hypothetical protein